MNLIIIAVSLIVVITSLIIFIRLVIKPLPKKYNILSSVLLVLVMFGFPKLSMEFITPRQNETIFEASEPISISLKSDSSNIIISEKDRKQKQDIRIEASDGEVIHRFDDVKIIKDSDNKLIFKDSDDKRTEIITSSTEIINIRSID